MSNSKTKKPFKPDRSTQSAVEEKWKEEVTNEEENRNPLLGIAVWLIVITVATFLLLLLQ